MATADRLTSIDPDSDGDVGCWDGTSAHHHVLMGSAPEDFSYVTSAKREVRVLRSGRVVTVLRGAAADRFSARSPRATLSA